MTAQTATDNQRSVSTPPELGDGAWVPLKGHIIVKRQKPRTETAGGIALPSDREIPQTWGQVMKVSAEMEQGFDADDAPTDVKVLDYVVYHPKNAVPIDVEIMMRDDKAGTNEDLFVVPVGDILAVFKTGEKYGD